MNTEHLRANVFAHPDEHKPFWCGALTQARFNRDMAYLAWCQANAPVMPRWPGDDGRLLRPVRGEPMPGVPHGCYDAAFIALAWPAAAATAGAAYWSALDSEYEAILSEAAARLADPDMVLAERVAAIEDHAAGIETAPSVWAVLDAEAPAMAEPDVEAAFQMLELATTVSEKLTDMRARLLSHNEQMLAAAERTPAYCAAELAKLTERAAGKV